MSIQSDIVTALSGVAGGRIYPQIAPEGAAYPLVNYRIINKSPIVTIDGVVHATDYQVVFECWAKNYASALTVADSVRAAIHASGLDFSVIDEPGEDYEPQTDSFMEPVYFEFLHS
jgi:hypothetical protein